MVLDDHPLLSWFGSSRDQGAVPCSPRKRQFAQVQFRAAARTDPFFLFIIKTME